MYAFVICCTLSLSLSLSCPVHTGTAVCAASVLRTWCLILPDNPPKTLVEHLKVSFTSMQRHARHPCATPTHRVRCRPKAQPLSSGLPTCIAFWLSVKERERLSQNLTSLSLSKFWRLYHQRLPPPKLFWKKLW